MRVQIICRNWKDDRIIPRMSRALSDHLGWGLSTGKVAQGVDAVCLSAYFEVDCLTSWPGVPVGAYFTHREEEPPGNGKAKRFDQVAKRVDLRITTAKIYTDLVARRGLTRQVPGPVERDRFVIKEHKRRGKPVIGVSGYTYANHRKGEDLIRQVLGSSWGAKADWKASGRGWPVESIQHAWRDMPTYYQGLDLLVVPSRVEGIPMPTLEALSCGVPVVISRGVGVHDELPDVPGIIRFDRGDLASLLRALDTYADIRDQIDPQALRDAVAGHSVEAFVEAHEEAYTQVVGEEQVKEPPMAVKPSGTRGIYTVAFGEPSRWCAQRLIRSIREHMPGIPVALCAETPLGLEDIFIAQPDRDVGGRRAKLMVYDLAPAEWQSVLYLDADTEVVAPDVLRYFEWVEAGWEFVICKDPHLVDTLRAFEHIRGGAERNEAELAETTRRLGSKDTLVLNGGVWAFTRNDRVKAFFDRWKAEWERHAQRDQPGLLRAMYSDPLRTLVLGNEWNTFPKYTKGVTTAGLKHFPGEARRWEGLIPGRIDSKEAWSMAKEYEDNWHPGRKRR